MALKSVDMVLAKNSLIHHIVAVSTFISVGFTCTCKDLGGTERLVVRGYYGNKYGSQCDNFNGI